MNVEQFTGAVQQAASLLRALGHENRLLILCQLVEGERSVGELAARLCLRQANVSQQLALLRREGLVEPRREAQTVYYRLAGEEARAVITVLHHLYCPSPGVDA